MGGDQPVLQSDPGTQNFRRSLYVIFADYKPAAVVATQLEAAQVGFHCCVPWLVGRHVHLAIASVLASSCSKLALLFSELPSTVFKFEISQTRL